MWFILFLSVLRTAECVLSQLPAGASAGYGFVKFANDDGAHKALSALNGFQMNGKTLKVSIARPLGAKADKTTLYVAGLPTSWNVSDFEQMFRQFGNVTESKLLTDPATGASRGVGFITLDSSQAAQQALGLNNTQPPGFEKAMQVKVKLPHSAGGQVRFADHGDLSRGLFLKQCQLFARLMVFVGNVLSGVFSQSMGAPMQMMQRGPQMGMMFNPMMGMRL